MPDTHGGDLGLEGYSTDEAACAYQCYVPESQEPGKRATDQKRKMTRDLKKLVDNQQEVARHLKGIQVKRWILVVPLHDSKEVTAHARKKELEMRARALAFLHPEFRIDIQTAETHFRRERELLDEGASGLIKAPPPAITTEHLDKLAEEAPDLLSNLEQKIERLLPGAPMVTRTDLRDTMQRSAVDGANLEDHLRVNHAPVYEQYLRERDAEEQAVQLESYTGVSAQTAYVTDARARFEERLRREVSGLRRGDEASRLSHAAVADWLRRCPMDFPISKEGGG